MANHSATDPMAAATQSLMDAVQSYVRAAVASEVANGSSQAADAEAASLKTQYDTALQENRELKDKIKKIESKKSTRPSTKRMGFPFSEVICDPC